MGNPLNDSDINFNTTTTNRTHSQSNIRQRNNRIKLNAVDITHNNKPCYIKPLFQQQSNNTDLICRVTQYCDMYSIVALQCVCKQFQYHIKSHIDAYKYVVLNILPSHNDVDQSLESVVQCLPYIHILNITASPVSTITQDGVVQLRKLHWLTQLTIDNTNTLQRDTYKLFTFNNLESLSLTGTLLTNTSVQYICNNVKQSLKVLKLHRYILLTDICIDYIVQCTQLQTLHLHYCSKLTDTALNKLSSTSTICNNLRHISIAFCTGITDASIEYLIKFTNLESLDISGCNQFTTHGIQRLFLENTFMALTQVNISKLDCIDTSIVDLICHDSMLTSTLQLLNVEHCKQLQRNDITKLQKTLSNCTVLYSIANYTVPVTTDNTHTDVHTKHRVIFICGSGDRPEYSVVAQSLQKYMSIHYPDVELICDHFSIPSFEYCTISTAREYYYNTYFSHQTEHKHTTLICHSLALKVGCSIVQTYSHLVQSHSIVRLIHINGSVTWHQLVRTFQGNDVFQRWERDGYVTLPPYPPHYPEPFKWRYDVVADMLQHPEYWTDYPIVTNVPVVYIAGNKDEHIGIDAAQKYIQVLRDAGNTDVTCIEINDEHSPSTEAAWQIIMHAAKQQHWFDTIYHNNSMDTTTTGTDSDDDWQSID